MDKGSYEDALEGLSQVGELAAPSGVSVREQRGKRVRVIVHSPMSARVGAVVLWFIGTCYLGWKGFEMRDQLTFTDPLFLGGLAVWLGALLFVIHILCSSKVITATPHQVRVVNRPWLAMFPLVAPTKDIRVVDMETIEKEHTRTDSDGFRETYSTWTYKVTFSRVSSHKPDVIYHGSREQQAVFLRHYLNRRIAEMNNGTYD